MKQFNVFEPSDCYRDAIANFPFTEPRMELERLLSSTPTPINDIMVLKLALMVVNEFKNEYPGVAPCYAVTPSNFTKLVDTVNRVYDSLINAV